MRQFEITILGYDKCGRTALAERYVRGTYVDKYETTIEDSFRKEVEFDGQQYILDIIDTAAFEFSSPIRDFYIRRSDGIILVYSITSEESFQQLETVRDCVLELRGDNVPPMVLVGNQVDLEKERTVNQIQGQEFAKKWNWSFFETSAKQGINVEEAFRTLIKQMDESQRMKKKEGRAFACSIS